MEDSHRKYILEIFEKFIFLRSISAFIFYLLFGGGALVRAYFGDVSFSLTQENLVFIGYAFMIIPISVFFGWLIDKRIQKQKEAEKQEQEELEKREQEQEEKERQEKIKNFITIIENLDEDEFFIIKKMLHESDNVFIRKHSEYSRLQTMIEICLQLKRKEIGDYAIKEYIGSIARHVVFKIHPKVWEILMELYINNPELFDRPDE